MSNEIEICFKKSVLINVEHEYETEDIVSILEKVNQIMETQDNVYCLSESIQRYVYVLQEFFKGNKSLEQVKQAYMSEAKSAFCVRCDKFLDILTYNYDYQDKGKEWICKQCSMNEIMKKLSEKYTLEELMFGVEQHSEFAKVGNWAVQGIPDDAYQPRYDEQPDLTPQERSKIPGLFPLVEKEVK